jgi:hypothetical protein
MTNIFLTTTQGFVTGSDLGVVIRLCAGLKRDRGLIPGRGKRLLLLETLPLRPHHIPSLVLE